ncbi:hypothetical protein [Streptomyces fulvorobeus]|uniref:Extensin n=1 Tax=Streptomyces fulvorobeus TaxID=284028 RepID=A0A7J0C8V4_9ACTN|nr:hypothetical protein [Streptomyces fulvorobeus]NYE42559.1 hypothetical protein [Streptomyces fulvorobeus]GFM98965.1 hypothetical protein Sfulv_37760 [Streptomyces fulvorobeus]
MADERYEWLDQDAAERLFRGEPVEPADDRARSDAVRLTAALEAVRALPPAGGELPGESTALAAFREAAHAGGGSGARAGRSTPKGRAGKAGQSSARPEGLLTVRAGGGRPQAGHQARWSRPTRYGLVLSLAGCALGGVAAASGAGMLPGPFGEQSAPLPAVSVSAAASADERVARPPSGDAPSPGPSGTAPGPRTPASSGSVPGRGHAGDSGGGASGGLPVGPGGGGPGPGERGSAKHPPDRADGGQDAPGNSGVPGAGSGRAYEKAVQACRDYRAGTLDRATRRRLVEMAESEQNLHRFCARLDGRSEGGASGGGKGDAGSRVPEGAPGGGRGGDDHGGDQGGDRHDRGTGAEVGPRALTVAPASRPVAFTPSGGALVTTGVTFSGRPTQY